MADKKPTENDEILLGIDYGGKNTGLAFGRSGVAMPLKIISSLDENVVIYEISRVALENRITRIVMGLPLTFSGKETEQSLKTRRFAKLLKIRLKRPLTFINEADTTNEALDFATESGSPLGMREKKDHISAALILKRYYSELEHKKD